MAEYIDREKAKSLLHIEYAYAAEQLLDEIPAADVAPLVYGRWIERRSPHAMEGISAKCSACSKNVQYLGNPLNYCPNCGAKMDGGAENAAD